MTENGIDADLLAADAESAAEKDREKRIVSLDPRIVWPTLIETMGSEGSGPEVISIAVQRTGLSPGNMGAKEDMSEAIDGSAVCGAEGLAAGDHLVAYLTDCYHMGSAKGRTKYELTFTSKVSGHKRGKAEIVLPSTAEIDMQRRRAAAYRPPEDASWVGGIPGGPPRPRPAPAAYTPYAPHPAAPQAPPEPDALRLELTELRETVLQLGRMMRGEIPLPPKPPEPITAQTLASAVAEGVAVALKAVGVGVPPAQPAQAPLPPASEVKAVKDPLEALDEMLAAIERFDQFRERARAKLGVPATAQPSEAVAEVVNETKGFETFPLPSVEIDGEEIEVHGVTGVEGDLSEWLKAMANANPKLTLSMLRNIAGRFVRTPTVRGAAAATAQAAAESMAGGVAGPTA